MDAKILMQDLSAGVSVRSGLQKKEAEAFVRTFFEVVEESLQTDKIVKIKGLGTFKVIEVSGRDSVNVNTGERIHIKGHSKVSFTPDSSIKDYVNRPFADFETIILNDGVDVAAMEFVDVPDDVTLRPEDEDYTLRPEDEDITLRPEEDVTLHPSEEDVTRRPEMEEPQPIEEEPHPIEEEEPQPIEEEPTARISDAEDAESLTLKTPETLAIDQTHRMPDPIPSDSTDTTIRVEEDLVIRAEQEEPLAIEPTEEEPLAIEPTEEESIAIGEAELPAEPPTEEAPEPVEQPTEEVPESVEQPMEDVPEPVEQPTEEVSEPVEPPMEKAPEPVEQPTEDVPEPVEQPTWEVSEPVEQPTEEAPEPVDQPTEEVPEPVEQPTEEAPEPVEQPTEQAPIEEAPAPIVTPDEQPQKTEEPVPVRRVVPRRPNYSVRPRYVASHTTRRQASEDEVETLSMNEHSWGATILKVLLVICLMAVSYWAGTMHLLGSKSPNDRLRMPGESLAPTQQLPTDTTQEVAPCDEDEVRLDDPYKYNDDETMYGNANPSATDELSQQSEEPAPSSKPTQTAQQQPQQGAQPQQNKSAQQQPQQSAQPQQNKTAQQQPQQAEVSYPQVKGGLKIVGVKSTHRVKAGEGVYQIARKYYGDPNMGKYIITMNKLSNPNIISVGQVLQIPELATK